jgi:eukaryotic-like serine/threonine-protein kinase
VPYEPNSQDREKRRRALFEAVKRLPERERASYLERETSDDPTLRDSVMRLIHATRAGRRGILDHPVYQRPVRSRQPEHPPSHIGPYPVMKHLGSGGMANVYACRSHDGGVVAVKLLRPGLYDADFLERFDQERAIQSQIDHPNVCRILGTGRAEHGTPFIVMELVNGQPIDRYCSSVKMPVPEKLRLFSQVLAGVECCHRRSIVHRDLKPANILVTADGRVKILDFGIAKVASHSAGMTGHGPTGSALPLMTPRYASPEQLRQKLSGRSSDIYSLGVVLYELLAGRHPFSDVLAEGTERLVAAIYSGRPAPPSVLAPAPKFSGSIDEMVLKALQFEPEQRYGSVAQFLECLRKCLDAPRLQRSSARSL